MTTIVRTRSLAIDNLRGIAILVMVFDHILIVSHGPLVIRQTVTRIAMPLFFIIGGHLAKRMSPRLIGIGVVGIFLPVAVPFVDDPNVLFWFALFAPIIVLVRQYPRILVLIVAAWLTVTANYTTGPFGTSYEPFALLGLMALGAMIPRERFEINIPGPLHKIGQYPLSCYVGHLLFLRLVTL